MGAILQSAFIFPKHGPGFFWLATFVPALVNLLLVVVIPTYGSKLGVQIYRYRRVYAAVLRQQEI